MAYSAESNVSSATTDTPGLRAYDGGALTLTGGVRSIRVNIANATNVQNLQGSGACHYRVKIATAPNGPWTVAGTVNASPTGSTSLESVQLDINNLEDATTYYVTAALDNLA